MPSNLSGATAAALQEQPDPAEVVPEMRIMHLNLADLEEIIHGYEAKYRVSTVQMLSNPDVRAKITEDDLLEWEAYVNLRSALREHNEQVHRQYLDLDHSSRRRKTEDEDPTAYAA